MVSFALNKELVEKTTQALKEPEKENKVKNTKEKKKNSSKDQKKKWSEAGKKAWATRLRNKARRMEIEQARQNEESKTEKPKAKPVKPKAKPVKHKQEAKKRTAYDISAEVTLKELKKLDKKEQVLNNRLEKYKLKQKNDRLYIKQERERLLTLLRCLEEQTGAEYLKKPKSVATYVRDSFAGGEPIKVAKIIENANNLGYNFKDLSVRGAIVRLVNKGVVVRVRHGVYQLSSAHWEKSPNPLIA